jgi:aldehyde dehydrogenase (NAD+)
VAGAHAKPNRNPSNVADVIGEYAQADAAQAKAAIAAAKAAAPAWAMGSIQERSNLLDRVGTGDHRAQGRARTALVARGGKTLPEGMGEAMRAGQIFKFFAGEVLRLAGEKLPSVRPGIEVDVTREPIGVVGLITPWNFPIAIPAWKIAPALAYGNTVVFKPADLVPGCAWALSEILVKAGIPSGVFNLVMGRGSVVGEALVNDPDVAGCELHGLGGHGPRHCREGGRADGEGPTRDGRQESAHRARRRRSRDRGELRDPGCVFFDRPALHGLVAADRARPEFTTASSRR